jgi:hypothetical protein
MVTSTKSKYSTALSIKCQQNNSKHQFVGFWCKLYVIHYDNKNQGFTRLNITQKNTID